MKIESQGNVATRIVVENGDVKKNTLEIKLPDGVTVIGTGAFKGVELPPILWIKEGAEEIAPSALEGHGELRSVSFPKSMRKIGSKAFANCSGLSNLDFCHTNMFSPDCFAGDYFIRWLRKDGQIARTLYFPRENIYAIMVKSPSLSTSNYDIYQGKFCTNPGFPNCEPNEKHLPLYFCFYKKGGKEYIWYDNLLTWAVQGAKYQAFNMTPRDFLGREIKFDGSSSMTINEFALILGICCTGIKVIAIWMGKKRNEYFKIDDELIKAAKEFAPLPWKKFEEVIAHQNEVWPADRNYFYNGVRMSDLWTGSGRSEEQGMADILQMVKDRGAYYNFNEWAY